MRAPGVDGGGVGRARRAAPALVPVAVAAAATPRPVSVASISMKSALAANGPSTSVGPAAPIISRQTPVISAR